MKTKIGMLLIAMCMSAIAFAQKPVEKTRVKKNFTPEQIAQKNVWNNEKHKKPSLFRSLPLLKKLLMINGNRNRKKRWEKRIWINAYIHRRTFHKSNNQISIRRTITFLSGVFYQIRINHYKIIIYCHIFIIFLTVHTEKNDIFVTINM